MKTKMIRFLLCMVTGVVLSALSARANVYATDIKLNGSLSTITDAGAGPVTISYRLNQAATLGVGVAIWQGTNQVATISGGTNMGLNTVLWGATNNAGAVVSNGTYSLSITAAASGFTNWEQISVDTNAGNYAFYPGGMAVDNNTNSRYYGRVVVGCGFANGTATNPISGELILDGIYKMNADGSFADEGGFGYGGYSMDDYGNLGTNEMPTNFALVPWRLRIGDDDRIYMLDWSDYGAIVAFDMQVTTNQVVIDEGAGPPFYSALGGPHNYLNNPDIGYITYGIINFDVTSTATTNAAVWLCDADDPNWGIWMYHLKNGQSDPNDTGTQAVTAGGDLGLGSTGGCMVDNRLDIFVSQDRTNTSDTALRTMVFTNWNGGILPPISSGSKFVDGTATGEVLWGVGSSDDTDTGIMDTVINSRTHPTLVATPMNESGGTATNFAGYDDLNGGIRVLNVAHGSVVSVTNGSGAVIQSLTNIDVANWYSCAAWDDVGNLYAASPTAHLWRVWSPPGTNTNTTVAVAQVIVTPVIRVTSITAVPTGSGCATVTINFTARGISASSVFALLGSSTVNGTYSAVAGAVLTGSSGTYQFTFSNCSTEFYKVELSGL
jgi:hypothetical protein